MTYKIELVDFEARDEDGYDRPFWIVATGIETLEDAWVFCEEYAKEQYNATGVDLYKTGLDMPPEGLQVITDTHYIELQIIKELS